MRLVLDTNILVSALIKPDGAAYELYRAWKENFILITSEEQLEELRAVTRYPKIKRHFSGADAGTMFNKLRDRAVLVGPLPELTLSPDPKDNFVLSMAVAGKADFLVTGDKKDLLSLQKIDQTKIISLEHMIHLLSS